MDEQEVNPGGSSNKETKNEQNVVKSGAGGPKARRGFRWKYILPVLVIAASIGAYLEFRSKAAPPTSSQWKLVWSDEFNGSSIDSSKWTVMKNSNFGSANRQDECNRAANVSVAGGALNIIGKQETVQCGNKNPDGGNNTYYFTSGMVTTRAAEGQPVKFKYKQGYIEARIKSPKGNAYWPAFWLVGPNDGSTPGHPDYGEFDVYEGLGATPDSYIGTSHFKCNDGTKALTCVTSGTNIYNFKTGSTNNARSDWGTILTNQAMFNAHSGPSIYDYQTYGFEWDANQIAWYINGVKIRYMDTKGDIYAKNSDGSFRFERNVAKVKAGANGYFSPDLSTVFNYDHSIILNLAMGGNMPTGERGGYTGNETTTGYNNGNLSGTYPDSMLVDYVRVYQKDTSDPLPPPPTPVATPSSVKATAAESAAVVSWQKPADSRVNQYQVRYIESSSTQKQTASAWKTTQKTTSLSQRIESLKAGTSYDFQVQSFSTTTNAPASEYSATVKATPTAPAPAPETGLRAAYFPKNGGFDGKPVYRTDKTVDFDWGWEAPVSGIDADFSATWGGKIIAPVTGSYTFTTRSDDGINLWVNNQLLVNAWKNQVPTENSATINLVAGQSYDIQIEYYDSGAGAVAQLFWQYPGQAKQIVPTTALRPIAESGLTGTYLSANGAARRIDRTLNFNWGTGVPISGATADNVLAAWTGTLTVPQTGDYTFTSRSDDGFTLLIDGQRIIDDWSDHSARDTSSQKIRLEAGKQYAFRAAYYERGGAASVQLYWTGPGITKVIIPETALRSN